MDEGEKGWDQIAKQEHKRRQIGKVSKFGGGLLFAIELLVGIVLVGLVILAIVIKLKGG
jgi:hypothetical protein